MANVRKRILQLTALESASLNTSLVGVDGGTTYRIELDTLADAVTARVNILDRDRLSSLESVTSSFETKGRNVISGSSQLTSSYDARYVISGSLTQTTWDNISGKPNGLISQSTDLSALNSFTQSQNILNTAFTNGIGARLQTSSFNDFSASVDSRLIAATNEQSLTHLVTTSSFNEYTASQSTSSLVDRLNAIENVSGSWITESETGSYLTSLNGAISSSSQVIEILSSLNSVSASLISKTGSYATTGSNIFIGTEIISGSLSISGSLYLGGVEILSASLMSIATGSSYLSNNLRISGSDTSLQTILTFILPSSGIWEVSYFGRSDNYNPNNGNSNTAIIYLTDSNNTILDNSELLITGDADSKWTAGSSYKNYFITTTTSTLFKLRGYGGSTSELIANGNTGVHFKKLDYYASGSQVSIPIGTISGSSQLTSSYDTRYTISGSVQPLPSGLISGSSQLTASYDTRYTLSGSVLTSFSSSVDTRLDTLEGTIISGSPNYVQVLGNRVINVSTTGVILVSGSITTSGNPVQIMVTGDANPSGVTSYVRLQLYRDSTPIGNIVQAENTSNINVPYCLNVIDTPSAGTYTYSMRTVNAIGGNIDFGEVNGPVLTAVELRTNTNLPSTNNTFTGTNTFRGISRFATVGGDEGGEIEFGVPQTNTTLSTRVVADIFQNRFRIFDGNTNGVFIDLSKAPTGVAGEIAWKTSGLINAGTFLTLDNLKVTCTTSAPRGLSVGAVSTNFTANVAGWFGFSGGGGGASANNVTYTTTAASSAFGWGFNTEGDASNYIITDKTNSRVYRVILMIGFGFNNNFISIERLH